MAGLILRAPHKVSVPTNTNDVRAREILEIETDHQPYTRWSS